MKLLVSDFDGTLFYPFDLEIFYKNIEKIRDFVNAGNMFVIATGRDLESLNSVIEGLEIPYSFIACNDGSIIYDKNKKIIFQNDIDENIVKEIYDLLDKSGNFFKITFNDNYGEVVSVEGSVNGIVGKFYDYEKALEISKYITKKYNTVYAYVMENYLCVRRRETNKGEAVKFLINKYIDVHYENIYVVGDHINDISMFKMFNGYAVINARDELLSYSQGVVKSVGDLISDIK